MPGSDPRCHPTIKELVSKVCEGKEETVIVEVGIGWGNIGRLIREIEANIRLIGFEIFQDYITDEKGQVKIYDSLILGDGRELIKEIHPVDIILLIDVLEHMTREDALEFLDNCYKKCGRIILSLPCNKPYPQGVVFGNKYEEHLVQWTKQEILDLGFELKYENPLMGTFEKIL